MTGRRIFLGAALIVSLAIIAALWGMQIEANRHLREQADEARRLLSRLAVMEVDNLRLSNIVVRANTPLADAQLAELEKLRDEVDQLRHRTNDLQTLKAQLRRLSAELASARQMIATNAVPAADIFPREAWSFAGYDTPEDAIESVTWAISQGDRDAYMSGLSSELQQQMQGQLADGNFAATGPLEMGEATGYRILDRQSVSENEWVITVYMDGQLDPIPIDVVRTADGWRIAAEGP
jgi:hypothetical protein